VIATRWHEADLVGWLLKEHTSEGWKVISMPAIAETNEGWRGEGAPLWGQKFPADVLARIREAIGTSAWVSLYQQRPAPEQGAIFHREWWQRYTAPPEARRTVFSLDTAFKANTSSDYSVVLVMAETRTGYYVQHVARGRWEFPELKRQASMLAESWKPNAVLIEDAASGQSLIQTLRAETKLPILPVKTGGADKQSRAHAVSPLVESGRVFLPESAPWLADFMDEVTSFPTAPHDDQVDALTQALSYLHGQRGWQPSDGGYQSVVRSVWAPEARGMTQREKDAAEDRQNDAARRMRQFAWSGRWGKRGVCW
jgi:predicted phage terminase large subunit-like protein